ncbi:MAG: GatB/YqeY domain-containing protein [Bacteroidales bacterium]|nr:GatB/YqeY domain-containing protein [Bacteroidales bacterium]MDY0216321.1 GatB/YqeY domain-containing protein [Bacteroidales bacterium]
MKYSSLLNNDLKQAMLARDKTKLEALRALKSAFTNALSEKGHKDELSDDEELQIIRKLIKQRLDSAQIYKEQNRNDLYEPEIAQAEVLKEYLPPQMETSEVEKIVKRIIQETGANSIKEMGKIMSIASKEMQGKTDNKTISEAIKKLLT